MSETARTGQIFIPSIEASDPQILQGSVQRLLSQNLNRQVTAEFLVGTDELVRKSGTLYAVQTDYFVLYDPQSGADTVCDVYALRFITFYPAGATIGQDGPVGDGSRPSTVSENAEGRSGAPQQSDTAQSGASQNSQNGRPVTDVRGVALAMTPARPHAQAALNYAKRKARKLD